jgi:hypothetical protein
LSRIGELLNPIWLSIMLPNPLEMWINRTRPYACQLFCLYQCTKTRLMHLVYAYVKNNEIIFEYSLHTGLLGNYIF